MPASSFQWSAVSDLESAAVELRPFRSLRLSPGRAAAGGLSDWIAEASAAGDGTEVVRLPGPPGVSPLVRPGSNTESAERAAATLQSWLADGTVVKERRPALWIDQQTWERDGRTFVVPLLVGLVRLGRASRDIERPPEPDLVPVERWTELRRALKADFQPVLLRAKAPLAAALDTTRRPELSVADGRGVRHDAFRILDYAQHVQLQGLVKNVEVVLAAGRALWEAAEAFDGDPSAAKMPGARFKLCAIADEELVERIERETGRPAVAVPTGLFGVSLEDPVY